MFELFTNMSKENIKCFLYYSLASSDFKLAEFANGSQREFLLSEAQSVVKKVGRRVTTMLETVPSSNGTWYYKTDKGTLRLLGRLYRIIAGRQGHLSGDDQYVRGKGSPSVMCHSFLFRVC